MNYKHKILIVGDIVEDSNCEINRPIFDEDNPSKGEVANLVKWISDAGYDVDVCHNVCKFVESNFSDKDVLIFPLWRGGASRNRTAIVPAYCEARNLPYIGGDAYVQTLCQDKSLSKILANKVGMSFPKEIVLRSKDDLTSFVPSLQLKPPFVVKPLYSACSIGVDDTSLCNDDGLAHSKAEHLFEQGLGPLVCEEFIEGEEIAISLIEENGSISKSCVGTYKNVDGQTPFYNRLYTFDDKMNEKPPWEISFLPDNLLSQNTWEQVERIIKNLGKLDIMRIDGRLNKNGFVLIELTPDIHMALESIFLGAFNAADFSPSEVFDCVIQSSLNNNGL